MSRHAAHAGFHEDDSAFAPPRFTIERDAQDELVVRWANPPSSLSVLRSSELRELALALLEAASASDDAVAPPDADDLH